MDIEGYAKKGLLRKDPGLEEKLALRILEIKDTTTEHARDLARAAIVEARATLNVKGDVLTSTVSGVSMGQFGVGSRGLGDFYAHEQIARIIGKTDAEVDSSQLDDSGAMKNPLGDGYIILTIDGMHSRLSDFPFLAGFHVARASLRDIYVMGSRPLALLSDIHLADDGDVGKIFDHIAGITTVSELTGIPLITGSTLRIGGDMDIGERLTGGVGAVGTASHLTSRIRTSPGDVILMSEGAGGGTISTAALYYEKHDVVDRTMNIKFLEACEALISSGLTEHIHAMTDVTNGGIRGDAKEISRTAGVKLVFDESKMRPLVDPVVLDMLEELEIDYLGVSLDALLVIAPESVAGDIIDVVREAGVNMDIIGHVEEGDGAFVLLDDKLQDFTPRFRESAYTPIKKMIGDHNPRDFEQMKAAVDAAALAAMEKKEKVIRSIRERSTTHD